MNRDHTTVTEREPAYGRDQTEHDRYGHPLAIAHPRQGQSAHFHSQDVARGKFVSGRRENDRFFTGRGPPEQLAANFAGRLALDLDRDVGTGQVQGPFPLRNLLAVAKHVGVAEFPLAGRPGNARDHLVVDDGKPPSEELQVERGPFEIGREWKVPASPGRRLVGRLADVTRVRRVFQEQRFRDLQQSRFQGES